MTPRAGNNNGSIEEETLPDYNPFDFYPVRIGEILGARYKIIGKLGYGANSTAWLARDLEKRKYVTVKVYVRSSGAAVNHEVNIYRYLSTIASDHPGRNHVRSCVDTLDIQGPNGRHDCLVHQPQWQSIHTFQYQSTEQRLPEEVVRPMLFYLLGALDYLHRECRLVHTGLYSPDYWVKYTTELTAADIKASNIMLGLEDESVLEEFEREETACPSQQNVYPDWIVYRSRALGKPKTIGLPVLCDLGLARIEGGSGDDDIQPAIYRAPEVLLNMDWTYSADIWNLGTAIWDMLYDKHLFSAYDPATNKLSNTYHMSEMVACLGPPPLAFLQRSETSWKYFDREGHLVTTFNLAGQERALESREEVCAEQTNGQFLHFVRRMLQWDPESRSTALELLDDPWLNGDRV